MDMEWIGILKDEKIMEIFQAINWIWKILKGITIQVWIMLHRLFLRLIWLFMGRIFGMMVSELVWLPADIIFKIP